MRAPLLRAAGLLLLAASGCAASGPTLLSDTVTDAELHAEGQWTPADARARALLQAAGEGDLPVRLPPRYRDFLDVVRVGKREVPVPRLLGGPGLGKGQGGLTFGLDLSALLGLHYVPRYWALPGQNALILLHRGQAPTVLPIDPDQPVGTPEKTPEAAYQGLRAGIERDLRGVRPPAKQEAQP